MTADRIGRYEIVNEIARGGMAIVYLAKDTFMERLVAVKVLPRVFMHDPQFEKRFTREARVVASLEHPAIVPVYDFGYQDDQPFMVYRYMSGGTLKDKIENEGAKSIEDTFTFISRMMMITRLTWPISGSRKLLSQPATSPGTRLSEPQPI
jgi:serine/threonine-protein kinase